MCDCLLSSRSSLHCLLALDAETGVCCPAAMPSIDVLLHAMEKVNDELQVHFQPT